MPRWRGLHGVSGGVVTDRGDAGHCLLLSGTFVIDGLVRIERLFDLPAALADRDHPLDLEPVLSRLSYRMDPLPDRDAPPPPGRAAVDVGYASTSRIDEVLSTAEYIGVLPSRVGRVRLVLGNLGTTALLLTPSEVPTTAAQLEESAGEWVQGQVALLARELAVPLRALGFVQERPDTLIRTGMLLWWDRIISVGESDGLVQVGTSPVQLSGVSCDVGYAKSFVHGAHDNVPDELAYDIARGIFMAAEDWLVADSMNRQLTNFLLDAREESLVGQRGDLTRQVAQGQSLAIRGQILRLYMDERDRYLAVERRAIWLAARGVWGLHGEVAMIDSRIRAVNEQITQLAAARQSLVDSARNGALYIIALLTVLQSFMVIADFNFADDTTATSPFRVAVALFIALAAAGTILVALVGYPAYVRFQARRLLTEETRAYEHPSQRRPRSDTSQGSG